MRRAGDVSEEQPRARADERRDLHPWATGISWVNGRLYLTNERGQDIVVPKAWIEGFEQAQIGEPRTLNPFAFGYAATVHKFQGSEADRIILVDEYDRPGAPQGMDLHPGYPERPNRLSFSGTG